MWWSYIKISLINIFLIFTSGCKSQEKRINNEDRSVSFNTLLTGKIFPNTNISQEFIIKSKSANSYDFMSLRGVLGALNSQIKDSYNLKYIEYQKDLIDNIIGSSRKSAEITDNQGYQDHFYGWISLTKNKSYHKEVVLYESYSFFYITQFLYILEEKGWVNRSKTNKDWWMKTLHFIEENEWQKWYDRSYRTQGKENWYFLRGRTHMGAHWAGIALYLSRMTASPQIKQQCEKLQKDYDLLLKRNLKPNPNYPSAYVWNSTYDNVRSTDATETRPSIVQDVSHGNHVISYLVAAYELGNKQWSKEDLNKLCNTFKLVIYNKESNIFTDNVDGSVDINRPGWGNFIADGWSKLGKYDIDIQHILLKTIEKREIKRYNIGLQLKANILSSQRDIQIK